MNFIFIFIALTLKAGAAPVTSNQISNFNYASCTDKSCVVLKAPKAYMGLDLENFVTSGETTLELTDTKGHVTQSYLGESVSYNPKIKVLVFETKDSGFMIYSLKDGSLSDFRTPTGASK